MKILIIEDNPNWRETFREMLRDVCCEIHESDGGRNLEVLMSDIGAINPDVVLLDHGLGRMHNGGLIHDRISEQYPDIKVVGISENPQGYCRYQFTKTEEVARQDSSKKAELVKLIQSLV